MRGPILVYAMSNVMMLLIILLLPSLTTAAASFAISPELSPRSAVQRVGPTTAMSESRRFSVRKAFGKTNAEKGDAPEVVVDLDSIDEIKLKMDDYGGRINPVVVDVVATSSSSAPATSSSTMPIKGNHKNGLLASLKRRFFARKEEEEIPKNWVLASVAATASIRRVFARVL